MDSADPGEQKPIEHVNVPSLGGPGAVKVEEVKLAPVGRVEISRERTRVFIAGGLTFLVAILFLCLGYRLLFVSTLLPAEHLDTYKTTLALLMGVYGTIVGFYFGTAGQSAGQ